MKPLTLISALVLVFCSTLFSSHTLAFGRHPAPARRHRFGARAAPTRGAASPRPSLAREDASHDHDAVAGEVRYLGSGDDAVVRPGVVLVAPEHEYDHFLMKSAVFVYAIGLDESQNTIIRGESPFSPLDRVLVLPPNPPTVITHVGRQQTCK